MKKKSLSFALCAIMLCIMVMALPTDLKVQAAVYPPRIFELTLAPGQTSDAYVPAMRDTFYSFSNTDSSVAEIEYTDPFFIYIVGKKPGSTVITLYGEFYDTIINVTVANPRWDVTSYYTVREGDTVVATLENYTSDCVFSVGGQSKDCIQITDHKDGTVSIKGVTESNGGIYLHAVNQYGYDAVVPVIVAAAEPRIAVSEIVMSYGVQIPLNGGANPPIVGSVYNIKSIQSYHKMLHVEEINGIFYADSQRRGDYTLYMETFTGKTLTVPVRVV